MSLRTVLFCFKIVLFLIFLLSFTTGLDTSLLHLIIINLSNVSSFNLYLSGLTGVEKFLNFYSSYITICIGKFNNLHWKQSQFLLVLQHEALAMVSG